MNASAVFDTKNSNDTFPNPFPDNKVCMQAFSLAADWPGSADIHVLAIQVSEL